MFFIEGRSFVNHADAYDQGYFWTVEMSNNLKSLFSGNGYPLWSWYRGTGLDTKLPIDPFLIIAALFPAGHIELGYTIAIILRLYCAGLAFIICSIGFNFNRFQSLFGSILYIFNSWVINLALVQGQFVNILIIFPLLIMSVDRIINRKSPVMFIVCVALAMAFNYYLAYMAAIGIIIYIFLRYFHYQDGAIFIKDYATYIGKFFIYGICGIMLSAIFVLVNIQLLTGASTGSSHEAISTLYGTEKYLEIFSTLVSKGYSFSYSNIGIPILGLIAGIVMFRKTSIRNTSILMLIIMFVMTLSPRFGSMFNGFSYDSHRWYFLLIFFAAFAIAENFDIALLKERSNVIIMFAWLIILIGGSLGFAYLDITGNYSIGSALFTGINLIVGFVIVILFAIGNKLKLSVHSYETILIVLSIATLILSWNCSFNGHIEKYFKYGEINSKLQASTQRVGPKIKDDGFYRIDQVDWINTHKEADQPVNENLWWQTNTLYVYDSKLPSKLTQFNGMLGNNYGYSKRVYMQSNGNRMGLDFLYGVKYFLGNDNKNKRYGADEYAGYGFSQDQLIDGVNVYKNKYDSSLGFEYDAFISKSEFVKLSRLEREQAILQAIVIPNNNIDKCKNLKQLNASDIDLDISNVPYEIIDYDGLSISDNKIIANSNNCTLTLKVKNVRDGQLVISFDNLRRYKKNGKLVGNFYLSCSNNKLTVSANNKENNQTLEGIVDYDLNMGYYDTFNGNVIIKFSRAGIYEFDKLYVSSMSTDNYDKYAFERMQSHYKVNSTSWNRVSGIVNAPYDGLMFFSIPVHENWSVYLDGKRVDKIENANIAFFAVQMSKGEHKVVLKYDYTNRLISLSITMLGVLATIIVYYSFRRSVRKNAYKEIIG